jgi:IS5 family transposase
MARPVLTATELAAAVRKLDDAKEWQKDLRRTYKKVGQLGEDRSRARMRGGGRQLARASAGVKATSTTTSARISVRNTAGAPMAQVATFGSPRRTGWYADSRFAQSTRQHPRWVGNDWTVATRGQGPRGINDAIADSQDEILDLFAVESMALIARAFPRGKVR